MSRCGDTRPKAKQKTGMVVIYHACLLHDRHSFRCTQSVWPQVGQRYFSACSAKKNRIPCLRICHTLLICFSHTATLQFSRDFGLRALWRAATRARVIGAEPFSKYLRLHIFIVSAVGGVIDVYHKILFIVGYG